MFRLGRETIKCKKPTKSDICIDLINIGRSDLTDFTSPFDFSDNSNQRNTSTAWKTVDGQKNPRVVNADRLSVFYSRRFMPIYADFGYMCLCMCVFINFTWLLIHS